MQKANDWKERLAVLPAERFVPLKEAAEVLEGMFPPVIMELVDGKILCRDWRKGNT